MLIWVTSVTYLVDDEGRPLTEPALKITFESCNLDE